MDTIIQFQAILYNYQVTGLVCQTTVNMESYPEVVYPLLLPYLLQLQLQLLQSRRHTPPPLLCHLQHTGPQHQHQDTIILCQQILYNIQHLHLQLELPHLISPQLPPHINPRIHQQLQLISIHQVQRLPHIHHQLLRRHILQHLLINLLLHQHQHHYRLIKLQLLVTTILFQKILLYFPKEIEITEDLMRQQLITAVSIH